METKQIIGIVLVVIIVGFTFWITEKIHQWKMAKYDNSIAKTGNITHIGKPVATDTRATATSDRNMTNPCQPLYPRLLRAILASYQAVGNIIMRRKPKCNQKQIKPK